MADEVYLIIADKLLSGNDVAAILFASAIGASAIGAAQSKRPAGERLSRSIWKRCFADRSLWDPDGEFKESILDFPVR